MGTLECSSRSRLNVSRPYVPLDNLHAAVNSCSPLHTFNGTALFYLATEEGRLRLFQSMTDKSYHIRCVTRSFRGSNRVMVIWDSATIASSFPLTYK